MMHCLIIIHALSTYKYVFIVVVNLYVLTQVLFLYLFPSLLRCQGVWAQLWNHDFNTLFMQTL